MENAKVRVISRKKRSYRIRKKISGTNECPRLCVRRTLKHISAQIINDVTGKSLVQVTSAVQSIAQSGKAKKVDIAKKVGEMVAEKAVGQGITKVVFDRKGYPYHGRIKSLADAARSKGLQF